MKFQLSKPLKTVLFGGVAAIALAGILDLGGSWWEHGRFIENTDNAYVQADSTTVAPKVSGYVSAVLVDDNQEVKAGTVLARIDDRDLKTALDQARADVAVAQDGIANIDAQLNLQQPLVDQAKADITASQAAQAFAAQDFQRYRDLLKTGYGTVQRAQSVSANLRQQDAQVARARAALAAAQQQIEVLKSSRAGAVATLAHNQAVAHQAELNLSYATITAPINGVVGARSVRPGQYVQAGTALMAVVPLQGVYVVANLKETQLTNLRGDEPVTLKVDSFPGQRIRAHVDSLSPASGLEFALLPPDNATGNFTKIVQRVPVKIVIDQSDPLIGLLRPGMSVEASIDTKPTVLALEQQSKSVAMR